MTTNDKDYYSILGLERNADEKDIKAAYKKAARKYHPDNTETGNEETFKKIQEAYEVLKDPEKRSIYDNYGAEGLKGRPGLGGFEDLGDIFSSFFGGGFSNQRGSRQNKGQDHSIEIKLKFLDPLLEMNKKIQFNPLISCKTCSGRGAQNLSDLVTCSTCKGAGQVTSVQNTILGQIRQSVTCPTCHGRGQEIKNPCSSCKGRGVKRENKELEVKIPAGIFDGATMRLAGVGDAGTNGGPSGDIYLHISVEHNNKFKREGADVYTEIDVDVSDAVLGTKIPLEMLKGTKDIKLEAGVQPGAVITLKDEGFPVLNNPKRRGNLFLRINVIVPYKVSNEERKLYEELQKLRRK